MIAIDSAVPRREEGTRTDDDMSASSMVSHPGRLPASLPHHTSVDATPASSLPRTAGGMRSCLGAVAEALSGGVNGICRRPCRGLMQMLPA